jgi:hypothetical protein
MATYTKVRNRQASDLTGQTFGRLTVIKRVPSPDKLSGRSTWWLCSCKCGKRLEVRRQSLVTGNTKSCGCLRVQTQVHGTTHPHWGKRGPDAPGWKGGRHITKKGYVMVSVDGVYRAEHDLVMARKLGRPLLKPETVHHKNGVRNQNNEDNLELWSKSHPAGQRVSDKVEWAVELLRLYAPEKLSI